MHSRNKSRPDELRWDGSPRNYRPPRRLRVTDDSPTKLLRAGQDRRCDRCGNRVSWHYRPDGRPLPLHPAEVPAADVPPALRWHLASGVAHRGGDSTAWCRLAHPALCPAHRAEHEPAHGMVHALRRALAVRTRRLRETGAFTPVVSTPPHTRPPAAALPVRDVVRLLHTCYLAPGALPTIRCVAQTRDRHRCLHPLTGPATLPGTWILLPPPGTGPDQLPFDEPDIAVYDLTALPYSEQLRWRAQYCPVHATGTAADITLTDWQPLNYRRHHTHLRTELPSPQPPSRQGAR